MTDPDPSPTAADPVDVAVVVVMYNSAALLPDLIASLPAGLEGLSWHLVMVDNDSTDDSVAQARTLAPSATIVATGRNGGYAAGINAGVAAAPPREATLVLNPDVRLQPGCVRGLWAALERPATGIAVPRLVDGDGVLIPSQRREPTPVRTLAEAIMGGRLAGRLGTLGEVVTDPRHYLAPAMADWAEGSTQLISAECWNRCGPWDESFFLYSEETEFALRARDRGLVTRFVPEALAVHLEGDGRVSPALWTIMTLNRVRLVRRRRGRLVGAAMWSAMVLREARRAVAGQETSRVALVALFSPRRLRTAPSAADLHPVGSRRSSGVTADA